MGPATGGTVVRHLRRMAAGLLVSGMLIGMFIGIYEIISYANFEFMVAFWLLIIVYAIGYFWDTYPGERS